MANGDAFENAVQLAHENPTLDVGCHLVLIQGRSLLSGENLPVNWKALMSALLRRKLDPYRELRAQVEKLIAAGVKPSHFDTHKHTHVTPPVFAAVVRLAVEFEVPFIRLPFDRDWRLVGTLDRFYRSALKKARVRTTNHFLGFRLTDTLREETFLKALTGLRSGSTEFMCHPGYLGEELRQACTRLKESREAELRALTSSAVKGLLQERGVVLANYRELA